MFKYKLLAILLLVVVCSQAQNVDIHNEQSFGKGYSSYYIGSGAFKRHLDLNRINYKVQEYSKSPAIVLAADFCIYPRASNAYLGLGPYFTSWVGAKETELDGIKTERLFSGWLTKFKSLESYYTFNSTKSQVHSI